MRINSNLILNLAHTIFLYIAFNIWLVIHSQNAISKENQFFFNVMVKKNVLYFFIFLNLAFLKKVKQTAI